MSKLEEVKAEIEFLKDIFKVSIIVLMTVIAGVSKLYLDNQINSLFYLGILSIIIVSFVPLLTFKKIKKHIKELGDL